MTAAKIAAALGEAYRTGEWWRCRCPAHESSGATLVLRDGGRGLIAHCHAGCTRDAVLDALHRRGLIGEDADASPPDPAELARERDAAERRRQQRIAQARELWLHGTADPQGTAVERYWAARGLAVMPLPATIRASRSWLRHPEGGSRPCMIALVEHVEYCPVAVHCTWLAVDGSGKAAFRAPRLSLGPVGGAAIRLGEAAADMPLIVGEGIETVASVMLSTGWPGWAAISAGGIERLGLPPLPLAADILVAADHDASGAGERAARAAAERWVREGRRVRVALPPEVGTDWNDVLRGSANEMEARHAA